jgi:hypothetical protein
VAPVVPVAAKPLATVSVGKAGIEAPKNPIRNPTLVGIAPQAIRQVSGAPQAAPDDLDWELPAGEQPEPPSDMAQTARIVRTPEATPPKAEASRIQPVQAEPPKAAAPAPAPVPPGAEEPIAIDVEELPPKSHPSGIGEKYVPRDQNAPAVVLNEEVQRTEERARATIEAQHRARSAPTIARMPAVRVPTEAAAEFADEDTVSHRRKRGRGVWIVLALITLGGGAAGAAVLLRTAAPPPVAETPKEEPVAVADTAAPPPPAVTAAPPPAVPEASASPAPEPSTVASSAPEPAKEPEKVAAAAPPVEAPKRTPAPAARPTKPKPAATTAKTSTGGASRPSRPAVIVRDNPF